MYAPPSPSVGASQSQPACGDQLHLSGLQDEDGAYEVLGGPRRSVALERLPIVPRGLREQSRGAGSETAWLPKLSFIPELKESFLLQGRAPLPVVWCELRSGVSLRPFPKSCFQSHSAPGSPLLNQCQMNKQSLMNVLFSPPPSPSLLSLSFRRGFLPLPPLPHVDLLSLRQPPLVRFPGVGLARTPQSGVTVSSA